MEKRIYGSTKNIIIIIGILVIIGIISVVIVKTTSLVQLKTVEAPQGQHVASNGLNKANTESLKVDTRLLLKDLNKSHNLELARVALQNRELLAKSLNKNSEQLLLKGLEDHKSLLLNELAQDKHLLDARSLQSSLNSHLLVALPSSKEVL